MNAALEVYFYDAPASFMQTFAPSNAGFPATDESWRVRPAYHVQRMGDYLRQRYNDGCAAGWEGSPAGSAVKTRYPNVLAEAAYCSYWPGTMQSAAGVSDEVMRAVWEDNEELEFRETLGIARKYHAGVGYLLSPKLSFVRPDTNKGRYRLYELKVWAGIVKENVPLLTAGMRERYSYTIVHSLRLVQEVILALENGIPVPYAAYRWAVNEARGRWVTTEQTPAIRSARNHAKGSHVG